MTKRKHISWKTKCAAALVHCNIIPREEAKLLEEDQLLSLFQWDHNEFYTLGSESRDRFWNLTPMLIKAHREKTKTDAKIIAKGRRIRRTGHLIELSREMREFARANPDRAVAEAFLEGTHDGREQANKIWSDEANRPGGALKWSSTTALLKAGERELKKRKIQSRGFDKTKRKKMDGTVVKR